MTPERWHQIETLCHRALELEESQRAAFLQDACAGDRTLQDEVERLMAEERPTASYDAPTHLGPGAQLGSYRIEALIGAGGMGEVFCAVDTRLGRKVAIKVSAQQFTRRFDREARVISALNHPHICTLYDVGPNYFVMELVEGENLAARLKKGPLPMQLVLRYGEQIADALAAAHAQGITHRDLKPANIMVTKSGVKVLDFGLAKITRPVGAPKQSESLTAPQAVMGTLGYMAPEQLEGKDCDARSDIFSLGLVLYEMATGRKVFSGDSQAALITDVMRCQPAPMESVPERFTHVVERSLARDPDDRWQTAKDVKAELSWAGKGEAAAQGVSAQARHGAAWRSRILALASIAALCAGILAAFLFALGSRAPQPELAVRFALSVDGQIPGQNVLKPSPDGRYVVAAVLDASGQRRLWLRALDQDQSRWIPGTEQGEQPFWSPDGRWIGFYAQGKIKKVSPLGGSPQTIAEALVGDTPTWNAQGDIIFAASNRSGLSRIKESGGPPQALTTLDASLTENSHRFPRFLPDGRHFLFTARCGSAENNAVYIGSLDSAETHRLIHVESQVMYVQLPDGKSGALLYVREGTLFRHPFDGQQLTGEPVAIAENVFQNTIGAFAGFAASLDGRVLVTLPASSEGAVPTWFKHDGTPSGILASGFYNQPRLSPDGGSLLFNRPDGDHGNRDVWSIDVLRGRMLRLTSHPSNELEGVWSPNGQQILFASDRTGPAMRFYRKNVLNVAGEEKQIDGAPAGSFDLSDWSHDGRWIAIQGHAAPDTDIWIVPGYGDRTAFALLESPFIEWNPRFSPDGKWIAYSSNESGRREVYVSPFREGPARAGDAVQVSTVGADNPVWDRSGTELFYLGSDFKMYAVQTRQLGTSSVPDPTVLFTACPETQPALGSAVYDTALDGRFLISCSSGQDTFVVTVNGGSRP